MALNPGDIAIIGYQADNPDTISFVALVDIPEGEEIFFTDNGVFAAGGFRATEGTFSFIAPAGGIPAGTIVTPEVSSVALSTSGDQIFAYQGSDAAPTFLFGAHFNGNAFEDDSTSSNTSALPAGLILGETAVAVPEIDNAVYNESVTSGTRAELLAAIANPDNWTGSNTGPITQPSGPFTVEGGDTGGTGGLVISEIMYNPASAEDDWEWVEVANTSSEAIDLSGYVIDDANSTRHSEANIASGTVAAGGTAVLYNADDISAADFEAAWGTGINLIAVTNWDTMGLNNGGDRVTIWDEFNDYIEDDVTDPFLQVVTVNYDDSSPFPADNGAASIFLTDLSADANDGTNWALSSIGTATPANTGEQSVAAGGNSGADIGSPGGDATGGTPNVVINELRISAPGDEIGENFFELFGDAGASLDGLTLLVLSGEFEPGQVDFAFDLTGQSLDADGFFLEINDDDGFDFFGSPTSFLLVDGFTGAAGDDLDSENDGVLDVDIGTVIDGVSLVDGDDTPDVSYAEVIVGPDGNFAPAGIARNPNGTGDFVGLDFGDNSADTPGTENFPEIDPPAEITRIFTIQGAQHRSPLEGQTVTTVGRVTAVDSNGFYLQDQEGDGDIATSDALFVFTSSAPGVNVGDDLIVTGTVSEFFPGGEGTGNLSTTQLSNATIEIDPTLRPDVEISAQVIGTSGRVAPNQNIDDDAFAEFDPINDGIDFFESLEGMLVTAEDLLAVAGTNRFGEIFAVTNQGENATGLSDRGTLNISPDDFNPEKIQIDEDSGVFDFDFPFVDVGATLGDVTGVVSYSFGNFEILPTEDFTANIIEPDLAPEVTELTGDADTLTIVSYNVLNLDPNDDDNGDGIDGNSIGDNDDDTDVANGRFTAIAEQIVNNLGTPDIIGLQEIQDNNGTTGIEGSGVTSADQTLQLLIDEIAEAGGPQYEFIDNTFILEDQSGGFPGGNIRTAFLYNPDRVDVVEDSVRPVGGQAPGEAFNGARLPLAADFEFNGETVTVVNNHFSSKGGSAPILGVEQDFAARQEDITVNGSLDERRVQAQEVNNFVDGILAEDAEANVVVLGDLNEFEFVSPLEILEGTVTSNADGSAITEGGEQILTNLVNDVAEDERYSFIFQGNSQQLDHILVSDGLLDGAEIDIVNVNSEFAETDDRASDHDPVIAALTIGGDDLNLVEGTSRNDNLIGTDGADRILGLGGNDRIAGLEGADDLDGGAGSRDTLNYRNSNDSVFVDLETGETAGGHAEGDTIQNFERVQGSRFADLIIGDEGANFLQGFGGEDAIFGAGGNDQIEGGLGGDDLDGGDGARDILAYNLSNAGVTVNLATGEASGGHAEGDSFANFEAVRGSRFADEITGDDGNNLLFGLAGDDMFFDTDGRDRTNGGAGEDTFTFFGSADGFRVVEVNANTTRVFDLSTGGVDTLLNIENIEFLDINSI